MPSLLENYLTEVAAHLQPMPAKRREEELRETRLHLEKAIAERRERGLSEDAAAREALQQFGLPEAVGRDVVATWRREQRLNARSLWSAVGCAWGLLFVLGHCQGYLLRRYFPHPYKLHGPIPTSFVLEHLVLFLVNLVIIGIFNGQFFPKRAIAGTALAMPLQFVYIQAQFFYASERYLHGNLTWLPQFFHNMMINSIMFSFYAGIAILFARISSRWRQKKMRLASR